MTKVTIHLKQGKKIKLVFYGETKLKQFIEDLSTTKIFITVGSNIIRLSEIIYVEIDEKK